MQIELNNQYVKSGLGSFKIDSVYDPSDIVDPAQFGNSEFGKEIDDFNIKKKKFKSAYIKRDPKQLRKDSYVSGTQSTNQGSQDSCSGDGSSDRSREETKTSYTQLMYNRWHQSNALIPSLDKQDILDENPIFNNGKKQSAEHQHHPEFTQQSYLRLRSLEEAFLINNYFENSKDQKPTTEKKKTSASEKKLNDVQLLKEEDRSFGIQKIFDLHQKKDYKVETLFIAAGIFDRYINIIGYQNFPRSQTLHLATICVLMSAKLEQPISPSFTRMINLLTDNEKKQVSKQQLIDLESQILIKLGFDFNFPGPIQSMERFLRVLKYDLNTTVYDMAFQICMFQLNDAKFLNYRPSQIAACSCILSINIYEEDQMRNAKKTTFFDPKKSNKLFDLNTKMWNNQEVFDVTHYSIDHLQKCLYDLSQFISENLSPNRLKCFDIEAILSLTPFDEIPSKIGLELKPSE